MQLFKDKKTLLYSSLLAVVLVGGYFAFFNTKNVPDLTSTMEDPTARVSGDLLSTLSSLNVIKLDNTIFSDPAFTALSDFGVTIPLQPAGRRNPFAPI